MQDIAGNGDFEVAGIDPKSSAEQSETPEDVASLFSWANLHGAKYRDFSSSRALARDEAKRRVEEALAAEVRRKKEEEDRRAQEEAQAALRRAAEAAEAARRAEAERLAEIAKQAEAERQAVLAAQEAARQAAQQRAQKAAAAAVPVSPFAEQQAQPAAETEVVNAHAAAVTPQVAMPAVAAQVPAQVAHEPAAVMPSPMTPEPVFQAPWMQPEVNENLVRPAWLSPDPGTYLREQGRTETPQSVPQGVQDGGHYGVRAPQAQQEAPQMPGWTPQPTAVRPVQQHVPGQVEGWGYAEQAGQGFGYPQAAQPTREMRAPAQPQGYPVYPVNFAGGYGDARNAAPVQAPMMGQPGGQGYGGQGIPAPQQTQYAPPVQGQAPMQVPGQVQGPFQGHAGFQTPQPVQPAMQAPRPMPTQPVYGAMAEEHGGERERGGNNWFAMKSLFDPRAQAQEAVPAQAPAKAPVLAVFSLAGGVGKTSLVASLGRALSSRGERVVLVDTAAYGLLPFFFGARDQRPGVLRTFNPPGSSVDAPVQLLALDPESQPVDGNGQDPMAQEILRNGQGASRILVDLPTASGATTRRILRLNPVVLVPVIPDMNSVVSVGAIEAFFRNQNHVTGIQAMPYYVLNQFDTSQPLHQDVREILREQIGDRLLPFALRRSPAVSEALAEGMTVIDYAPNGQVTEDYANLAGWVRSFSAPANLAPRGIRWSER